MNNLAVIPARGGSKRIPGKNIKKFLGKPIIAYSIEAAFKSGLFKEVIVSTDSKDIAFVAKKFGAKVPFFRSSENANDIATLADVVEEVRYRYNEKDLKYDHICCILATAPLITIENLKKGLDILVSDETCDSVKPIIRFSYPIQRALRFDGKKVSLINPEFVASRSQDLELTYYDAGQFYWMRFDKGLRGENKFGFEISEMDAQDIDTPEDWSLAEFKYKYRKQKFER